MGKEWKKTWRSR